jgi:AmmeMemoRadiSam system protein A
MSGRLSEADGATLLTLARAAIEDKLFASGALEAARRRVAITQDLAAPRACFVTLKLRESSGWRLRGCIGTTEARLPAHDAVVAAALDAAFADPRFSPLTREEYPDLLVSVSALTPFVRAPQADAIVPGQDGVVLELDGRQALFLPEVATEQGWSATEMLEHLARKAGLPPEAWRRATLFTFASERFGEGLGEADRIRRP